MQVLLGSFATLCIIPSVAVKENGVTNVAGSFLRKSVRLQPDVVAHSLSQVEEEWKDMAIAFAECNQTMPELHDDMTACKRAPKAFQKSCTTVVNSLFTASNGDRGNVEEYMADVCAQGALTGWKQEHCRSLASSIVNTMTLDAYENRQRLAGPDLCKSFWSQFTLAEKARLDKERMEQEAMDKKEAENRAAAEKKVAEERAAAEKKRLEQEAIEKKEAEDRAAAEKKIAEDRAAQEKKRLEQEAIAEKKAQQHAKKETHDTAPKKERMEQGASVNKSR